MGGKRRVVVGAGHGARLTRIRRRGRPLPRHVAGGERDQGGQAQELVAGEATLGIAQDGGQPLGADLVHLVRRPRREHQQRVDRGPQISGEQQGGALGLDAELKGRARQPLPRQAPLLLLGGQARELPLRVLDLLNV